MEVRWHGHSFFTVVTREGKRIAIDPFFRRTSLRPADIKADLVLVTHAHGDHADDAMQLGAPILATFEVANEFEKQGAKAIGMGIGGFTKAVGARIFCAFATHSSSFEATLAYGGNPCGFVIDDGDTRFYHAGDTGLFGDMRAVIRDLLQPHLAALPIGDHYTMGAEHAARAVEWLGVDVAIPMHYDTFPEIRADPKDFERRVGSAARVVIPAIDGGIEIVGSRVVRLLPP